MRRHFWVAATAIKKTWINSEADCITEIKGWLSHNCDHIQLRQSLNGKQTSYSVPDYHTIHIILCMLLWFRFTNSPIFQNRLYCTSPYPSPPPSPPVKGESLACVQGSLRFPFAFLIKHSSSLFVSQRSLLPGLWLAGTGWWMHGAFLSEVLLYLCIIHHHTTTLLKESGLKTHFWKSLEVLFLDWLLILVRELKLHYLKCDEMRAHSFSFSLFLNCIIHITKKTISQSSKDCFQIDASISLNLVLAWAKLHFHCIPTESWYVGVGRGGVSQCKITQWYSHLCFRESLYSLPFFLLILSHFNSTIH